MTAHFDLEELRFAIKRVISMRPYFIHNDPTAPPQQPQKGGPAPPPSVQIAALAEDLVTALASVLSFGLVPGMSFWNCTLSLEKGDSHHAALDRSGQQLKSVGQVLQQVRTQLGSASSQQRTKALLRALLNTSCLITCLELLAVSEDALRMCYIDEAMLRSTSEPCWEEFLTSLAPIGGPPIAVRSTMDVSQIRATCLVTFQYRLQPTTDVTARVSSSIPLQQSGGESFGGLPWGSPGVGIGSPKSSYAGSETQSNDGDVASQDGSIGERRHHRRHHHHHRSSRHGSLAPDSAERLSPTEERERRHRHRSVMQPSTARDGSSPIPIVGNETTALVDVLRSSPQARDLDKRAAAGNSLGHNPSFSSSRSSLATTERSGMETSASSPLAKPAASEEAEPKPKSNAELLYERVKARAPKPVSLPPFAAVERASAVPEHLQDVASRARNPIPSSWEVILAQCKGTKDSESNDGEAANPPRYIGRGSETEELVEHILDQYEAHLLQLAMKTEMRRTAAELMSLERLDVDAG
jgi:hypothetical protein